jgi:hypothetical protein
MHDSSPWRRTRANGDPALSNLPPNLVEADDALHNPDVLDSKIIDGNSYPLGIASAGCL